MRSSSIKSLTATAMLIAILTLAAAPAAQAATATERAKRTVTRFMQRIVRIMTTGELPADPVPLSSPLREDETTTTTNSPKKSR